MNKFQKSLKKFFRSYKSIPQKKQYLEFITALLSIPFLITVIILNFNTLNNLKKAQMSPTPVPEKIYITVPGGGVVQVTTAPVAQEEATPDNESCIKELGAIDISSPREGEVVTDNPVTVSISYDDNDYCEAVWAYRINNGRWSDYDNRSIALYNLSQGNIKLELRAKSVASKDEETLTRNFIYRGESQNSATSSAN